eukprot:2986836-Rhodomonas_salina.1
MLTLDGALIGRFWPPERIVAGMRTSRWVRDQLIKGAQKVLLKGRKNGTLGMNVTPADVAQDLMRFEQVAPLHLLPHVQCDTGADIGDAATRIVWFASRLRRRD